MSTSQERNGGGRVPAPSSQSVITSRQQVAQVMSEVKEVLKDDLRTYIPPSIAELMAAEMRGEVWNFFIGQWEPENA